MLSSSQVSSLGSLPGKCRGEYDELLTDSCLDIGSSTTDDAGLRLQERMLETDILSLKKKRSFKVTGRCNKP